MGAKAPNPCPSGPKPQASPPPPPPRRGEGSNPTRIVHTGANGTSRQFIRIEKGSELYDKSDEQLLMIFGNVLIDKGGNRWI